MNMLINAFPYQNHYPIGTKSRGIQHTNRPLGGRTSIVKSTTISWQRSLRTIAWIATKPDQNYTKRTSGRMWQTRQGICLQYFFIVLGSFLFGDLSQFRTVGHDAEPPVLPPQGVAGSFLDELQHGLVDSTSILEEVTHSSSWAEFLSTNSQVKVFV